jgi:SAM-dependent methyltransferase
MLITDTISPQVKLPAAGGGRNFSAGDARFLADAISALGVEPDWRWAWDNYKHVVRNLSKRLAAHRLIEIGGGRDPLFDLAELGELDAELTLNDIDPAELAYLPKGYPTACFDIVGDLSDLGGLHNSFDLAFSRMVFEHVADGQRAWANLYELLAPGGVALAFIPTLYSPPFVVNWLLPHKVAAAIVRMLYAERRGEEDPVFPPVYSWCFADEERMRPMLSAIGYREVAVLPFYGHGYYQNLPIVRDAHEWFAGIARRRDWRTIASFAYVAVRK